MSGKLTRKRKRRANRHVNDSKRHDKRAKALTQLFRRLVRLRHPYDVALTAAQDARDTHNAPTTDGAKRPPGDA